MEQTVTDVIGGSPSGSREVRSALTPGVAAGAGRLILGGRFGEQPDVLSFRLLDRFASAGGRIVETAATYADGAGERTVGAWLASAPPDVVVITKVGHPLPGSSRVQVDRLAGELARSADRLGVDQLDVVLLHRDDPAQSVTELLGPLVDAVADGRVAGVGVANWTAARLRDAMMTCTGGGGLVAASSQLSLAVPAAPLWPGTVHADAGLLALHHEAALPLVAWSANARGWFAGRLLLDSCGDADARRSFHTTANLRRLDRVRMLASARAASATALALAWTLGAVSMALPVIGPAGLAELEDALVAAELVLAPDDLACLSSVS
jgi:1-deoxyxylulose-5-phosphate synthase